MPFLTSIATTGIRTLSPRLMTSEAWPLNHSSHSKAPKTYRVQHVVVAHSDLGDGGQREGVQEVAYEGHTVLDVEATLPRRLPHVVQPPRRKSEIRVECAGEVQKREVYLG